MAALAQPMSEHTVKVGLIFNFGKFVEWPVETIVNSEKFRICYLGTPGALHRELARLDGKSLQNKPVEVLRITGPAEIRGCLMLVFGDAEARYPKRELLRIAGEHATLTIGDAEGFAAMGGAFGLVNADNRVTFEVNVEQARTFSLRIPANLARLGKPVATTR